MEEELRQCAEVIAQTDVRMQNIRKRIYGETPWKKKQEEEDGVCDSKSDGE